MGGFSEGSIEIFENSKDSDNIENYEYSFDNKKGVIKIDKEKKEILLKHQDTPMPIDEISNIEEFKYDGKKLDIIFKLNNNLKF